MAAATEKKKGLGRGLSALLADAEVGEDATKAKADPTASQQSPNVPIDKIFPNPDQPRQHFSDSELNDLARSIEEKGIIQPLILRNDPSSPGNYQIVAGERRWRAAQKARLHEVPAIVRDIDDTELMELAIIENVQREDLNPIEEAQGLQSLMDRFGHTQDKLSKIIGKSRSHIANLLRLLNLPQDVIDLVSGGQLTAGHARALVATDNASDLAKRVVKEGLSVRQVEELTKSKPKSKEQSTAGKPEKDADTRSLEADLSAALGMKVSIDFRPDAQSGTVKIGYKSLEDLDALCQKLSTG